MTIYSPPHHFRGDCHHRSCHRRNVRYPFRALFLPCLLAFPLARRPHLPSRAGFHANAQGDAGLQNADLHLLSPLGPRRSAHRPAACRPRHGLRSVLEWRSMASARAANRRWSQRYARGFRHVSLGARGESGRSPGAHGGGVCICVLQCADGRVLVRPGLGGPEKPGCAEAAGRYIAGSCECWGQLGHWSGGGAVGRG